METKISAKRVESLKLLLGFAGCFAVSSAGLSGGIGMVWSGELDAELMNYRSGHIDMMVRKKCNGAKQWRVTGLYGAPIVEDRHHSWRFMRTLYAIQHDAWMCIGDF